VATWTALGVPRAGVPLGEEGEWYMEWRASGSSSQRLAWEENLVNCPYYYGIWIIFCEIS